MLAVAAGIPAAGQALPFGNEVDLLKSIVAKAPAAAGQSSDLNQRWADWLQHGGWWPATKPAARAATTAAPAAPPTLSAPAYQGDAGEYPFICSRT